VKTSLKASRGCSLTASDNTAAQKLYDRIATRANWVVYERELG